MTSLMNISQLPMGTIRVLNGFDEAFSRLQGIMHQVWEQHTLEVARLQLDNKQLRDQLDGNADHADQSFPDHERLLSNEHCEQNDPQASQSRSKEYRTAFEREVCAQPSEEVSPIALHALNEDQDELESPRVTKCENVGWPAQGHAPSLTQQHISSGHIDRAVSRTIGSKLRKPWSDFRHPSQCSSPNHMRSMEKIDSIGSAWNAVSTGTRSDVFVRKFPVIDPVSNVRVAWLIFAFTLWIYDLVMLPIAFCFNVDAGTVSAMRVVQVISLVFWAVDIPLTFVTGTWDPVTLEISENPQHIFRIYLRSWFLLDLFLVVQEFLILVVSQASTWVVQMLQLVLLIRWFKLAGLASQASLLGGLSFSLSVGFNIVLQMSARFIVAIHLVTCFWYGLGSVLSDGWVSDILKSEALLTKYAVSLRWTCSRLHGLSTAVPLSTDVEIAVDSILILFSLLACAMYMGRVTAVLVKQIPSHDKNLKVLGTQFVQRHKISFSLNQRMRKYLEASKHADGGHVTSADEKWLLSELPLDLRNDLIYESRWRIMKRKQLFIDMFSFNPRVVHHVCTAAVSDLIAHREEILFSIGDACGRMLIVRSGRLVYTVEDFCPSLGRKISISAESVSDGAIISEAVLWTHWEHCGTLLSKDVSVLLSFDPSSFADVIVQYETLVSYLVKYAKLFIRNMFESVCSDTTQFDNMSFAELDEAAEGEDSDHHFFFISHYKVEAGTEATLMRESFEKLFDAEPMHPANEFQNRVFVDSECLDDLADLKQHIVNSTVVIILLTPGLFSRPWCLIELVTAIQYKVPVLPVEIQRPGVKYEYPDDEFYLKFSNGEFLSSDDIALLEKEGVELDAAEMSIRRVFQLIASPFSPHKTKSIRDAELKDILKRALAQKTIHSSEGSRSRGSDD